MSGNSIVIIFSAYLIGSLSFAIIASRALGLPDPRSFGSKNPGATNVFRSGKKTAALLTLLGDALKGWLMVFVAQQFGFDALVVALTALAVFLGHVYPVFFAFRGGKGVATALGIILALNLWVGLGVAATWIAMYLISRISSLSALTAATLAPLYAWLALPLIYFATILLLSLWVIWRHRENIRNLVAGQES